MAEKTIRKITGKRIRSSRKMLGITQDELAKKCDVNPVTVSCWERGRYMPEISTLKNIASLLNVTVDYLLGNDATVSDEDKKDDILKDSVRPLSSRLYRVPVLSREWTACCGSGIPSNDITSDPEEFIPWPMDEFREFDDMRPPYAVVAEGACLESVDIRDGDRVIINPAEVPPQGTVALVRFHEMLSLKYIYRLKNDDVLLLSDTEQFRLTPEEQEDGDFAVIGAVVGSYHYHSRPPAKPLFNAR